MKSYGRIFGAVLALGLMCQAADARDKKPVRDTAASAQKLQATGLVVGAGATATYLTQACRHDHCHFSAKWFAATTVGCMVASPMLGAAIIGITEHRELLASEVFNAEANCLVPFIGGWISDAAFAAHPEWNRGTGRPTR
jgi:hypothetical protein